MGSKLVQLNQRWEEEGLPTARIRIGIATGPVVVGAVGSPNRLKFTSIGDTVNVAQRLEALGKEVEVRETETEILVSGATAALLGDRFELRPLGNHLLRGLRGKTEVFELLGETLPAGPA